MAHGCGEGFALGRDDDKTGLSLSAPRTRELCSAATVPQSRGKGSAALPVLLSAMSKKKGLVDGDEYSTRPCTYAYACVCCVHAKGREDGQGQQQGSSNPQWGERSTHRPCTSAHTVQHTGTVTVCIRQAGLVHWSIGAASSTVHRSSTAIPACRRACTCLQVHMCRLGTCRRHGVTHCHPQHCSLQCRSS